MINFLKSTILLTSLLSNSVGASWVEVGKQKSSHQDYFGHAISISSKLLVVGAPYYTPPTSNMQDAGIAKIYERDGNKFKLVHEIEGKALDQAGQSVAVSRGTESGEYGQEMVIVGSPRSDQGGRDSGLAQVFYYSNLHEKWAQLGQDLVGGDEGELFGETVAISNDGLLIAVGTSVGDGLRRGKVVIYTLEEVSKKWEQIGFTLYGENAGEEFGTSISIEQLDTDEDNLEKYYIAIGGPKYGRGLGIVRVYRYDEDNADWGQMGEDLEGMEAQEHFGQSLSLGMTNSSHLNLIVGSPSKPGYGFEENNDGKSTDAHVQIFSYNTNRGDNTDWIQFGTEFEQLDDSDGTGDVVVFSDDGKYIAIGSPKFEEGRGAVRVFVYDKKRHDFRSVGKPMYGKDSEGLGTSLAFSGDELAIGSPFKNSVKIMKFHEASKKKSGFGKFIVNLFVFGILGTVVFVLYKNLKKRGFKFSSLAAAMPGAAAIRSHRGRTAVDTNETDEWPFGFFSPGDKERIMEARRAEEGRTNVDAVRLHGMPKSASQDESSESDSDDDDSYGGKKGDKKTEMRNIT